METLEIVPRGQFSLEQAAGFGFGSLLDPPAWEGVMRLAFAVDGGRGHAAIALRQSSDGNLRVEVESDADLEAVRQQVMRILSLDHDGQAWHEVGERDPVIGSLQRRLPGLRPVLFHSPWEGGLWALISNRQGRRQARRVLDGLGRAFGREFEIEGVRMVAAPQPDAIVAADTLPGLSGTRAGRVRALAHAATRGELDADRLREIEPVEALANLQQLPGIGPFTAGLMLVRAAGTADVLPPREPTTMELVRRLYDLPSVPTPQDFAQLGTRWAPFRTWAMVLLRVADARGLLDLEPDGRQASAQRRM